MSDIVTKTLYRSLLRTSKPFASTYHGPILCSLLYRLGLEDEEYLDKMKRFEKLFQQSNDSRSATRSMSIINQEEPIVDIREQQSSTSTHPSTKDTKKHSSFMDVHLSKQEARDLTKTYNELRKIHFDKDNNSDDEKEMSINDDIDDNHNQSPAQQYFKHLLRQLFFDEKDNVLRQMYFPSQTMSSTTSATTKFSTQECTMGQKLIQLIKDEFRHSNHSSNILNKPKGYYYSNATKRETGFMALRELQKKLSLAESLDIHVHDHSTLFHYHDLKYCKDEMILEKEKQRRRKEYLQIHIQAKENVYRLPTQPPSSYLQSGTFLLANPHLRGIFDRSVICILQHTEQKNIDSRLGNDQKDDDASNDISLAQNNNGGTYGLIINDPLMTFNSSRELKQVIHYDAFPDDVWFAFGKCKVKKGGPVNLSLQMLRRSSPEDEERLKIGGTVLPHVITDTNSAVSTAMYSDNAIYYGGDIKKAAKAVIDFEMDREAFTFVVGASCWESGQLEAEINRGYWLPCAGPPTITMEGIRDHYGDIDPKADLWLSMMSALSEEDGRLANLLFEKKLHGKAYACDDFR